MSDKYPKVDKMIADANAKRAKQERDNMQALFGGLIYAACLAAGNPHPPTWALHAADEFLKECEDRGINLKSEG